MGSFFHASMLDPSSFKQGLRSHCTTGFPAVHIGKALSTAAQHSPKSPGMNAALAALDVLLATAAESAIIKDNAAAGSLAISMRQQLQQAGVLQQLAALTPVVAADLRSEAAALGGMGGDELRENIGRFASNASNQSGLACWHLAALLQRFRVLWGSAGQSDTANTLAWLCDPSGCAEAAMQLCTATRQQRGAARDPCCASATAITCSPGQPASHNCSPSSWVMTWCMQCTVPSHLHWHPPPAPHDSARPLPCSCPCIACRALHRSCCWTLHASIPAARWMPVTA
mgnify:CR=1 FL=1